MLLTLPIHEVVTATPRARLVRIDLQGHAFPFEAGQALLVARAGHAARRPYSIAVAPEDVHATGRLELLVGVDAQGRPGQHLELTPGSLVDVEGPIGRFTCGAELADARLLFVAGGTGIAPLRAMLRHALTRGHTDVSLLYSARSPEEFAFGDELRGLAEDHRIALELTVTRSGDGESDPWTGARGRIDRDRLARLVRDAPARQTICFVCGPKALVEDVPRLLVELGVDRSDIRREEW